MAVNIGAQYNFNKIPMLGIVPEKSSSAPASPVSGQLWIDTSVSPNKAKWYDGTSWIAFDTVASASIVDSMISSSAAIQLSKLATDPLARANHTGTQLAATISNFDTQVHTARLDQLTAPTASVSMGSQLITNVLTPVNTNDAANKQYVDNARAGIAGVKDPVRVTAQVNITISAPGATIDSATMVAGDRFLAANQTTTTEKGIYVWNGAAVAATRALDADTTGEILDGTIVAVAEGTDAGGQYIQTATPSGAPGAWSQVWTKYNTGGTTYTAGTGLTLSSNSFSLSTPVSIANGGTGGATAAAARTALSATGKFAVTMGALTAGTAATVNHALGTTDVTVACRTVSDGARLELNWIVVDANNITVTADIAFAASAVRVVVVG